MAHNCPEKTQAYIAEARQYFLPMAAKVGLTEELERAITYIEQRVHTSS